MVQSTCITHICTDRRTITTRLPQQQQPLRQLHNITTTTTTILPNNSNTTTTHSNTTTTHSSTSSLTTRTTTTTRSSTTRSSSSSSTRTIHSRMHKVNVTTTQGRRCCHLWGIRRTLGTSLHLHHHLLLLLTWVRWEVKDMVR